jgi:hypothetical protein
MSWKSSQCSDCTSGWKIGAVPVEVMGYSHLQSIKPGSGAHPVSWIIATGRHSLGVKLTAHLNLVLRLRMRAVITPLPNCLYFVLSYWDLG